MANRLNCEAVNPLFKTELCHELVRCLELSLPQSPISSMETIVVTCPKGL